MKQAYYRSSIEAFLQTNDEEIIGRLNLAGTTFASQWTITTNSWHSSIQIFKKSFHEIIQQTPASSKWHIFFEYEIPRLSSRIDVVIIADDLIFVIEFKLDRENYEIADVRQVEDYALDLTDFHLKSRGKIIIPILLAPLASPVFVNLLSTKKVFPTLKANSETLSQIINDTYKSLHNDLEERINPLEWEQSEYEPTPTIVQAAKALFAGQQVENITRKGAENLTVTSNSVINIINKARERNKKVVCFVTGVPGAGKTLVGLKVVHEKELQGEEFNSAYFSGNGPLINVLKEALSRDNFQREDFLFKSKKITKRPTKKDSYSKIKSKIQNLHQFIKDGIRMDRQLTEKVVVFDEAQRCWNAKHFSNKAKQNKNRENKPFHIEEKSEAELLFEFMNRHDGWSAIIALVGGGQEINTGEGGISEWGKAIKEKYSNWEVYISPELLSGDSSTSDQKLFETIPDNVTIKTNKDLHLNVSQRSFRATHLNSWVNAVINNNETEAFKISSTIKNVYPLFITRNINTAKKWLREQEKGTKRFGLIASSGALRLKPYGINVKEEVDEAMWFLNDETDIRSSYYLEIVATEYKIQGLELDWTCVCWDADLRRTKNEWDFKNFSGTEWNQTKNIAEQQFLLNTYRVLLTRAREGIIIFLPSGDEKDGTRLPEFYDPIFEYLKSCGMEEI
ncbi:DUF2075 domain-containing protein [Terrimonas pollutisoli]|uniref:DUF2075 domain-containing protein n=1 Tax=Terrimonas pollutisoli TaxID=3034147 RepID=UPI0023ED95C7|nr:DUF2075 domain-containing protein [Terrimonas sp. H1YJ31]